MAFVPIQLKEYVKLHLRSNPGEKAADVTARLHSSLKDYKLDGAVSVASPSG
jgi:hypothetical protein